MTVVEFAHHQFMPGVKDRSACDYNYPVGGCTMSEREHDLSMMRDPNAWPQWPILPLKRSTPDDPLDCGFIAEQEEIIVYHGTMFEVKEAVADTSRHLRYSTWDEVYDDGWRVD